MAKSQKSHVAAGMSKAAYRKAFKAFWCQCEDGPDFERVTFHDDNERGAACAKHHWTCDVCHKVAQVG